MTNFTASIQKLEEALQVLRDLDNVHLDTLPEPKLGLYLERVERLIETWESLPRALAQTLAEIRSQRDYAQRLQDHAAWLDALSPDERARVKAKMRAIFDNPEEVQE